MNLTTSERFSKATPTHSSKTSGSQIHQSEQSSFMLIQHHNFNNEQ